jgi:hypothetical protein
LSASVLNDPRPVLHLCREGTGGETYGQRISFYLSRFENIGVNSRTRCDIVLAESCFVNTNVMTLLSNGRVGINTTSPNCQLTVAGVANIHNGSPYATANNFMASGSLTIGGLNVDYGGGNLWTANTAGLMMECLDKTEIAIHDSGQRLESFMHYVGGGTNQFYIGRDMGWGQISQTNFYGNVSIGNSLFLKTDIWNLSSDNQKRIYCGNNSTTYFRTGGTTSAYVFRNPADNSDIVKIDTNGSIRALYCEGSYGLYLNVTTNNYWNILSGLTPTGVVNSLLFYHLAIGINSVW